MIDSSYHFKNLPVISFPRENHQVADLAEHQKSNQ